MADIIRVRNLTKKYNGLVAVDNISFSVKSGEIFAFLGPNGAGKSTTIKIMTTLLNPTSGDVRLAGKDIKKDKAEVRKLFGIVFQDPSLDDELTAFENLEFHAALYNVPRKERLPRIKTALELVDLWNRKDDYVKKYSGGMKRRLEIARGLIHHPRVLFLDEPTLGLDPQTRNRIWEHIKKLNKERKMTIFFTTHYMQEAEEVADTVSIIDHGKIIDHGTVAGLIKKTKAKNLEEVFLDLTGRSIREESESHLDRMRLARRMRH